jgi:transposase
MIEVGLIGRFAVKRVLGGIIFSNCNGLRWRDAPECYGPNKTRYSR